MMSDDTCKMCRLRPADTPTGLCHPCVQQQTGEAMLAIEGLIKLGLRKGIAAVKVARALQFDATLKADAIVQLTFKTEPPASPAAPDADECGARKAVVDYLLNQAARRSQGPQQPPQPKEPSMSTSTRCAVPNCKRDTLTRGVCSTHYYHRHAKTPTGDLVRRHMTASARPGARLSGARLAPPAFGPAASPPVKPARAQRHAAGPHLGVSPAITPDNPPGGVAPVQAPDGTTILDLAVALADRLGLIAFPWAGAVRIVNPAKQTEVMLHADGRLETFRAVLVAEDAAY
jgi:hypothetical protein